MNAESKHTKDDSFFVDPFQDEDEIQAETVENEESQDEPIRKKGYIGSHFSIQFNNPIEQLSSDFAKAYVTTSKNHDGGASGLYALVFDKGFPVDMDTLSMIEEIKCDNLTAVLSSGKTKSEDKESFAIVLERPAGKTMREIVESEGRFSDLSLRDDVIGPIGKALGKLKEVGICLGNINPDNVYFDSDTKMVTLREPFSEFCGYSQNVMYESLSRVVCSAGAKGNRDMDADYFALGMLSVYILTGKEPLASLEDDTIIDKRLKQGTADSMVKSALAGAPDPISQYCQQLIRGLTNDSNKDRWVEKDLMDWKRKKNAGSLIISRVHKETSTAFIYEGEEYHSRIRLIYDLQKDWARARSALDLEDLSRWVKLGLKLPNISDEIESMGNKASLTDKELARVLILLDEGGAIRFQNFAINIWGVGSFVACAFIESKKEYLQVIGKMFALGLVEYWINTQEMPEDYSFSNLLWTPLKISQYMHRLTSGFGMERCLYMLNPDLPCQSNIISDYYASDLDEYLLALDKIDKSIYDNIDPVDRHGAAFIGSRIDLTDDITVKSVQGHPSLSKNPQITMLALLSVAQGESNMRVMKGLAMWMMTRALHIADEFHNERIKKDFIAAVGKSARTGVLNDLFKTVSNISYIKRDQSGFLEARRQYKALSFNIMQLGKESNIEKVAYQYGLRIAVMFAYVVAVLTLLLIVIRAA